MSLLLLFVCISSLVIVSSFNFWPITSKKDEIHPMYFVDSQSVVPIARDILKVRGISPSMKDAYSSNFDDEFFYFCDNQSKKISKDMINDNYCDCMDKSDEKGTSACSFIDIFTHSTLATSNTNKFMCMNKGFKSTYVPFSHVDDGICDCCDGSDEGSLIQCPNVCSVIAHKEMEQLSKLRQAYSVGSKLRSDAINQVTMDYESKTSPIAYLSDEIQRQKASVAALLGDKENEDKALDEHIKSITNTAIESCIKVIGLDKMSRTELLSLSVLLFDYHHYTESSIVSMYSTSKDGDDNTEDNVYDDDLHLDGTIDAGYTGDTTDSNDYDGINDGSGNTSDTLPHTCSVTANTKYAGDTRFSLFCDVTDEAKQHDELKLLILQILQDKKSFDAIQIIMEHYTRHNQSFDDALAYVNAINISEDGSSSGNIVCQVDEVVCSISSALQTIFTNLDIEADRSRYSHAASDRYTEANDRLTSLTHDLAEAERAAKLLDKYNSYYEFLSLKDDCFTTIDGKFTYKLCSTKNVIQSDNENSGGTILGEFESISTGADDEGNIDGSIILHYKNGQYCHAFGSRTADVRVTCGESNVLLSAAEPSTCYYSFALQSPMACNPSFANYNQLL